MKVNTFVLEMQDSPTVLQMCQMKGLMGHLKMHYF
uniref:Uncharacterized protein n=1 Tax=Anguilla anguilla TaxID=7936 RepID=A0A0E9S5W2_ANGAN